MALQISAIRFRRNAIDFARLFWWRFNEDRCLAAASALSYTSLLALVPLTAIGFALLSAFPVFENIQAQIMEFVFANVVPSAVDSVKEHLDSLVGRARSLTAVGVVGLAVTSLLLFLTIETSIDTIFKSQNKRSLAWRLLVFWGILTLGPLLIGASFSIATLAFTYTQSIGGDTLFGPFAWISRIAPALLVIAAFTLFYAVIPNRPVRIRHALIGGTVAGIAFSLLRLGFTIYVTTFPAYSNLYGALAIVPMFLFWMYLSWAVILVGAVVTAELPNWGRQKVQRQLPTAPGARLALALAHLAALYAGIEAGRGLDRRSLAQATDAPAPLVDTVMAYLRDARLVERTDRGRWLPIRDASTTTLHDVVLALSLDLRAEDIRAVPADKTWRRRVAEIIANDTERSRDLMSISLRSLLLEPPTAGEAPAALPLRRAP